MSRERQQSRRSRLKLEPLKLAFRSSINGYLVWDLPACKWAEIEADAEGTA